MFSGNEHVCEVSWAPIALLLSKPFSSSFLLVYLFLSKSQDIPGAPLYHYVDSECDLTISHIYSVQIIILNLIVCETTDIHCLFFFHPNKIQ